MGKLNKQSRHEKRAISLQKEVNRLWQEFRKLGYYKLDKPIRNGWEIQWKLRDDVAKSKNGKYMQKALDLVKCTPEHCDNDKCFKTFKKKFYQAAYEFIVKSKNGVKIKILPRKLGLTKSKYDELDPKIQKYFTENIKEGWGGIELKTYSLNLTYELETKISRSYITHRQVFDPKLEKKFNEVYGEYTKFIYDGTLSKRWNDWSIKFKSKRERMRWRNAKSYIENGENPDNLEFEPKLKNSQR
jgi:hypothetical protein